MRVDETERLRSTLLSFTQLRDNASIQPGVVPAKAGDPVASSERRWIPAFAGMTE